MMSSSSSSSWIRCSGSLLIAFAFLPWSSVAKTVSGDFKLSDMKSLQVLTSFSVVPDGARLAVNFTSPSFYENERFLKLRLYRDVEWASVLKAQTCVEKIKLTQTCFEKIKLTQHT
jgi:hypothetical protein